MENLCIFYASKYHLSLVILEYLKNKNTKKYTVNTFLENPIEDEIKNLIKKYKLNINAANEVDFKSTKDIANKKIKISTNMIFIINGNLNYMKEANDYIKNEISKQDLENVKIINCFDFNKQSQFAKQIFNNNDKIIYTTGEKYLTNLY